MISNTIKAFRRPSTIPSLDEIPPLRILAQTVEELRGKLLIPRTVASTYTLKPLLIQSLKMNGGRFSVSQLERLPSKREVLGIDSTAIPIAESREGILLAARASLIRRTLNEDYGVERVGPILAYITERTLNELRSELVASRRIMRLAPVDPWYSKQIIMTILENWLLWRAVSTSWEAIILVDGSLRPSIIKLRNYPIQNIIREAERRGNTLIGVSKRSKLFKWCPGKLMKLAEEEPPSAVEVPEAHRYLKNLLGNVYFALLSKDGMPLRVDVSLYEETPLQRLNELYSSDYVYRGYPETLRRAHVFSKLSKTERIGLRSSLRLFDARLIPAEKERVLLFGAFCGAARDWRAADAHLR